MRELLAAAASAAAIFAAVSAYRKYVQINTALKVAVERKNASLCQVD